MDGKIMYTVTRYESYITMDKFFKKYFSFEETISKCRTCPGYRQTWSCPEFDFDTREFLKGFDRLHFIVEMISNENASDVEEAQTWLFKEKRRFDRDMLMLEKEKERSMALAAQECMECKKCARLSGHPCVHPEVMRYGLEALGALPARMVPEEFGFDILWSDGKSIPEYYLLVGGVFEVREDR